MMSSNCPNKGQPEWTQSRFDTILIGYHPKGIQFRMDASSPAVLVFVNRTFARAFFYTAIFKLYALRNSHCFSIRDVEQKP